MNGLLCLLCLAASVASADVNASSPRSRGICDSIHGVQCWGDDLKNIGRVSTHEECCQACQTLSGCNAWTWNFQYGQDCYLKSACSDQRRGSAYHSGIAVPGPSPGPSPPPTPPSPPTPTPPSPPAPTPGSAWYDGIDSVKVVSPGDDVQSVVNNIHNEMYTCQFCSKRYAVLLKRGDYGSLNIPVGYYTSVAGVGSSPSDVTISGFYVKNDPKKMNTINFWRSVEGITASHSGDWRTSQGCSLRRSVVHGGVSLSGGPGVFSSGGFISDVEVGGTVSCGTQQQFFFRNSKFAGTNCHGGSNYVYAGVEGSPSGSDPYRTTVLSSTPTTYGKPFLTEDSGSWSIVLPSKRSDASGPQLMDSAATKVPLTEVYVAKQGDTGASINAGIDGKSGLLLTPGVYELSEAILVSKDDFVVLGIGFPTLIATGGNSALTVEASNVRVAQVLFEAGSAKGTSTQPLLHWKGNGGVASDIFTRVGSFQYRRCGTVQADVMIQIDGSNVIIDNTWNWHADHDDCGRKSDQCYSESGLRVTGSSVTAYGPSCEHSFKNLLDWQGEDGRVYFYQSELPYHDEDINIVGYSVDYGVQRHEAHGVGVYIIRQPKAVHTAIRVPPSAKMSNMFDWTIGGGVSQFHHLVCTDQADAHCYRGEKCSNSQCFLRSCCGSLERETNFTSAIVV